MPIPPTVCRTSAIPCANAVRAWAARADPTDVFDRFEASGRRTAGPTTAFAFVLDPAEAGDRPAVARAERAALSTPQRLSAFAGRLAREHNASPLSAMQLVWARKSDGWFAGIRDRFLELGTKLISWWRDSDVNREIRRLFHRAVDGQLGRIAVPARREKVRALLDALVDPSSGWPLDTRDVAQVTRAFRSEEIKVRLHAEIDRLENVVAGFLNGIEPIDAKLTELAHRTGKPAAPPNEWEHRQIRLHACLGSAAGILRTNRLLTEKLPQSALTEETTRQQLARVAATIARASSMAGTLEARLKQAGFLSADNGPPPAPPGQINCAAACPASE